MLLWQVMLEIIDKIYHKHEIISNGQKIEFEIDL